MSHTRINKDEKVNDENKAYNSIPGVLKKYKPFYTINDINIDDGVKKINTEKNIWGKISDKKEKAFKCLKHIWLMLTKPVWNLFILISLIVLLIAKQYSLLHILHYDIFN